MWCVRAWLFANLQKKSSRLIKWETMSTPFFSTESSSCRHHPGGVKFSVANCNHLKFLRSVFANAAFTWKNKKSKKKVRWFFSYKLPPAVNRNLMLQQISRRCRGCRGCRMQPFGFFLSVLRVLLSLCYGGHHDTKESEEKNGGRGRRRNTLGMDWRLGPPWMR